MTITPVATTDVANYISSPDGTKSTTAVVVAVNPDGTAIGGSGASATQVQGVAANSAVNTGNPVKVGAAYNTTPAVNTDGDVVDLQATARGILLTAISTDGVTIAGTAIGSTTTDGLAQGSGLYVMSQGRKFNGTTWDRDRKPNGSSRIVSAAASTNATVGKASAGDLHLVSGNNVNAAIRYLKIYNKATAPTVGTDTPVITMALEPLKPFHVDWGGHYFSAGIAYALTTGAADADTGALTAGDILGFTITYA